MPQRRFTHNYVDIVGPLPVLTGATHIFTVIDRTTRWPEAIPLSGTTAADCAAALLTGWIQRFGLPCIITSDRGPQFTSSLWSALCSLLSIKHSPTTAYHPQSNGIVERFHRRLKDALRARAAGPKWVSQLPWFMLGIRTAWRDGDFSPAEAVFGAQPILPGQFLDASDPPPPNFVAEFQGLLDNRRPLQTHHHNTAGPTELPEELLLARHVLVRRDAAAPPLTAAYDGPYLVLERSLRSFKLQIGNREEVVSTLRLKPCTSPADVSVAVPPRRGCPPAATRPQSPAAKPTTTTTDGIHPSPTPKTPKKVTFRCPLVDFTAEPPPFTQTATPPLRPSGRPVRATRRPLRCSSA